MGYTTEFSGHLTLSKQPTQEQVAYINAFSNSRRMRRNAEITATFPDPIREAVGLPVGFEGGYYVGPHGQDFRIKSPDIVDLNTPPGQAIYGDGKRPDVEEHEVQPGLWCQWVLAKADPYASEDDAAGNQYVLEWGGGEKFYNYVEWLEYLIHHFFTPWGIILDGEIEWVGEDRSDIGLICVDESEVTTRIGRIVYE